MSLMVKGIPVFVLVGLGLFIVGGLFHIIGLATPYWHTLTTTNSVQKDVPLGHHGLWMECKNINDDIVDCNEHAEVRGVIQATQAMEILALLCGIICMCITGIWFFLSIEKFKLVFMIVSLGSGFLASLFGIIGIIIYAADINSIERRESQVGQRLEASLSWSYALCVISSVISVFALILIAIGIRMKK